MYEAGFRFVLYGRKLYFGAMMAFRMVKIFFAAALITLIGACADMRLSQTPYGFFSDSSYQNQIIYGLERLAEYEDAWWGDDAGAYYRQRLGDLRGGQILPPPPADQYPNDIKQTYEKLFVPELPELNREKRVFLAEAQLNYECWYHRTAMGRETSSLCRQSFEDAWARIDADVQTFRSQRAEQARKAKKAAESHHGSKNYAVYFDKAKAIISDAHKPIIREAAADWENYGDAWRLYVRGVADPSGNRQQNMILSMRRAMAVRNALAQNGVPVDSIFVAAAGEMKQEENIDLSKARRVDIILEPVDTDHSRDQEKMRQIAPHHF